MKAETEEGRATAHWRVSVLCSCFAAVKSLLGGPGVDVKATNETEDTPLHDTQCMRYKGGRACEGAAANTHVVRWHQALATPRGRHREAISRPAAN